MKNKLQLIALPLLCCIILASCGGDGNSKNSGGSLKKNPYLGSLPAIYADYNAEKEAYEKKIEEQGSKLLAGGEKNKDKIMKLMKEEEEKTKAMKEKLEATLKAEIQRLNGTELPISYSEQLKQSDEQFYTISGVKLVDNNGKLYMAYVISAKDKMEVPRYAGTGYSAYYRYRAADGSTIQKSVFLPIQADTKPQIFDAGQQLYEGQVPISMSNRPRRFANFDGVEFISKEEYNAE